MFKRMRYLEVRLFSLCRALPRHRAELAAGVVKSRVVVSVILYKVRQDKKQPSVVLVHLGPCHGKGQLSHLGEPSSSASWPL